MGIDFKKVSIIGVGLIGGSFALSLKAIGFEGVITGIGRTEENLLRAKDRGIIDDYSTVPSEGVADADLILLATPVGQFLNIAEQIRGSIKRGAIVTDVGSVKAELVRRLEHMMPEGVSFVGGHPIAGSESSGIDGATADLFRHARCILTPTQNTDKDALSRVAELWRAIGSRTLLMSPEEHDWIFAAVSHLPHVVAYILVNTIIELDGNILPHGGQGFKDMTRIALSPPELWVDICSYNKENILELLDRFSSSVMHIRDVIERSDWDTLRKRFHEAKAGRQRLEEPDRHNH